MDYKVFNKLLSGLNGKETWGFKAGESTGSIFTFEVGEKFPWPSQLGSFEGDFSLMVYSSWRIEDRASNKLLTCWRDAGDQIVQGLKHLENQTINEISVSTFFDLSILFKSQKVLRIFCDYGPNSNYEINWFLRRRKTDKYYSVNNKNGLIKEVPSTDSSIRL